MGVEFPKAAKDWAALFGGTLPGNTAIPRDLRQSRCTSCPRL